MNAQENSVREMKAISEFIIPWKVYKPDGFMLDKTTYVSAE